MYGQMRQGGKSRYYTSEMKKDVQRYQKLEERDLVASLSVSRPLLSIFFCRVVSC